MGLLGFIREENLPASLKLMGRALTRLDHLFIDSPAGRLCWIGSAAIESQLDGQLLPRRSRKQLFSRLDRGSSRCSATRHTKRRVACSRNCYTSSHWRTAKVRLPAGQAGFLAEPAAFTDHLLEDESQRLAGPGQAVMRSLSSAIREELASLKDLLDLIERGTAQAEAYSNLHNLLGKMAKTTGMVGLSSAASTLQAQLGDVSGWSRNRLPSRRPSCAWPMRCSMSRAWSPAGTWRSAR